MLILRFFPSPSQIIVGYIGDKPWLRPSTWYSGLTALGGISMALIPLVRNYYLVAFLSACYGLSVSANYTLASVILVEIISLDKFTNAYGLLLMVQGIASMIGPPLAGKRDIRCGAIASLRVNDTDRAV